MGKIKNICIYGVGGVGGYFGAKLIDQDQNKNFNVSFIARGKHLEEIKSNGLKLYTEEKEILVFPDSISDNIRKLQDFDLIILCVKGYDLDEAVNNINEHINEETIILPLLNGVDIYDRIRKNLKKGIVLPACVYVGTHIDRPGVISQKGGEGSIIFGKDPNRKEYYPEDVIELFRQTNIVHAYEEAPFKEIWTKYMFIASFGLVTAHTGKTFGEILENKDLSNDVEGIMKEIEIIASKNGINLDQDVVSKTIIKAKGFPYDTKTSYQRDVEILDKKNEGDLFGGTIIRMGKEHGVDVSVTSRYYMNNQ